MYSLHSQAFIYFYSFNKYYENQLWDLLFSSALLNKNSIKVGTVMLIYSFIFLILGFSRGALQNKPSLSHTGPWCSSSGPLPLTMISVFLMLLLIFICHQPATPTSLEPAVGPELRRTFLSGLTCLKVIGQAKLSQKVINLAISMFM